MGFDKFACVQVRICGHSALREPLLCDCNQIFFICLTQRNCLPSGGMRLVPQVFGKGISAITAITIGKGELHCHSTNLKRGVVNSLCTMHYMRMKRRSEKRLDGEIMSYFT